MVGRRRAWHNITDLGQHTRSATSGVALHHRPWKAHTVGNVGRGMTSMPLDSTHGQMASGVACHHRPWTENAFEQRWAWHASSPFGSTQGRKTSGMAYHHRLWAAQTTERRQGWHDFTALGRNTRSNDVGRGMTSPPLDCTHSRTTSGVE